MSPRDISGLTGGRLCGEQPWGTIATNVPDPPACISDCRARFLRLLLPNNETFAKACEMLSDKGKEQSDNPLWDLYCCDSQLCGVDNLWESGQDPNVNWLINSCQNIGYHSILDSGPPIATHTCSNTVAEFEDGFECPLQAYVSPTGVSTSFQVSLITVGAVGSTISTRTSGSDSTRYDTETRTASSHAAHSTIQDPSLGISVDLSEAEDGSHESNPISTGIKVTIVLTTLAGLTLLVTFVLCLLRNRRISGDSRDSIGHREHELAKPPDFPILRVRMGDVSEEAADTVKPMPPPRLEHRRYLPPPSKLPESRVSEQGKPAVGELHEGVSSSDLDTGCKTSQDVSLCLSPLPTAPLPCLSKEESSTGWISNAGTLASSCWTPAQSTRGSSSTGIWPLRQHRPQGSANSSIPSSPGPPPDRALPCTPPKSPPKSPTSVFPKHRGVGMAVTSTTFYVPYHKVAPSLDSQGSLELADDCFKDSHCSWGSWGVGVGGARPDSMVTPTTTGMRGSRSRILDDGDWQRMMDSR